MIRPILILGLLMFGPVSAIAQGTQITFGTLSQDTSAPVEVSADQLQVNQSDGSATYRGNVVVGQGDMRMAAGVVRIVYSSNARRIDRLEARGGVTLVSGEEAAEGDEADYNIEAGTVLLRGNVLLTQGPNAITADRMLVDLESGTAQMSGRVRTVFQQGGQ